MHIFQEKVPGFNFSHYLEPLLPRRLNSSEPVVIYALPYFQELTKLVEATEPRTVANYVLWRFVRHRINNLVRKRLRYDNKAVVRGACSELSKALLGFLFKQ